MSEYWKSTPSYWCKFCSQYVRDSSLERKNHEASAKHQNNIQRSLRELHKNQEIERREKQRAKDEVARLNGMFDGKAGDSSTSKPASWRAPAPQASTASPQLNSAAQRKAHAEQLAALGVQLPDELKKQVTGVGDYHTVSSRWVEAESGGAVLVNRSLADILAESRRHELKGEEQVEAEEDVEFEAKGGHKRKAEDDLAIRDEEAAPKRKAWGSNIKSYPGVKDDADDGADLDSLLIGVAKKKEPEVKSEKTEDGGDVKQEEGAEASKPLAAVPDFEAASGGAVKQEAVSASASAVTFKKRKGKR